MVNDNVTRGIYIVCLVVIVCFAIAFLSLSYLYFKSKKLLYVNGLEDVSINKEISKDMPTLKKKAKNEDVVTYFEKRGKSAKTTFSIWNIFLFVICGLSVGIVGVSLYSHFTDNQVFIGNTAMLVIQTGSMESVHPKNTYIKENNLSDNSNRIEHYAFITIEKVSPEDMNIYDIYAFKMFDVEQNKEITVVHRLIGVETKEGKKLYTFKGDANGESAIFEKEVGFEKLVGKFTGYQNVFLGYFFIYLRSSIGMITLVVAVLLLLIYSMLYSKLVNVHDKRYLYLLGLANPSMEDMPVYFAPKMADSTLTFNKINDNEYAYTGVIKQGTIQIEGLDDIDIYDGNYELVLSSPSRNIFDVVSYKEEYEFNKQMCYLMDKGSDIEFISDKEEVYDLLIKIEEPYNKSSKKMLFLYSSIHRGEEND